MARRKRRRRNSRRSPFTLFTLAGIALCAVLTCLLAGWFHWPWILAYVIAVNLVTFCLYGYDKAVAGRGLLRVPEMTLHAFALAGGSVCVYAAQRIFAHKTLKRRFRTIFWLVIAVQIAVLAWALWYFYG